jgi:hypothetical protein
MAIDASSTRLVDEFAQQVATFGSDARKLVQQNITDKLGALDGRSPKLPVGPVAEGQKDVITYLVLRLLQSQQGGLADAIRAGAQARVNALKTQLSNRVADRVASQLNRSFSFYDSWTDPLIGLRGRLNLSKAFYLTAETDVGGFGIGSDIAVDAYAALGCQFTRYIYSEVGYRYLYDDFRADYRNNLSVANHDDATSRPEDERRTGAICPGAWNVEKAHLEFAQGVPVTFASISGFQQRRIPGKWCFGARGPRPWGSHLRGAILLRGGASKVSLGKPADHSSQRRLLRIANRRDLVKCRGRHCFRRAHRCWDQRSLHQEVVRHAGCWQFKPIRAGKTCQAGQGTRRAAGNRQPDLEDLAFA